MKLSTQPYKGTRDFYPEDKRLQKYIFSKWREVCESFGYQEYDGPILEPFELYASKTSEEIVNEQTYSFTDRGDRKVVMRPEMTPTVSRMVAARRQELAYPLRLYSIPNCFRYERPQRGRLREFWQLNADIFGVEGTEADAEIVMLANAVMKSFGAKSSQYEIKVSSRQYINDKFDSLELVDEQKKVAMELIDKREKIKPEDFNELLVELLSKDKAEDFLKFLNDTTPPPKITDLLIRLSSAGVDNIVFNPDIARGFDYYTDIVFEVFDTNPENNRSMFGGGRYDGLVGAFGVDPVATVGFGMGDVPLLNFLESNKLLPELQTETDLAVVLVGEVSQKAAKPIKALREMGLNIAVDFTDRKLDKKIKTVDKLGVRFAVFMGEQELESQLYILKDLKTGKQETKSIERIVSIIKDYREK